MRLSANNISIFKLPQKLVGPLMLALIIFYLVFHVISGEHGLYALFKEQSRLDILQTQLQQVQAERIAMESKVHRMSDKSLDRDMLDEQARSILGDAEENETVVTPRK